MWAKMINDIPHINKKKTIRGNECIYINPTREQYIECGYKEFITDDTELPEKEGYYISAVYYQTDTTITQRQQYFKCEVETDEQPSD